MRVLKMFVGLGYFCSKDRIVWVIAQCMCSMQVLHMPNMCSMMMMNCFCGMVDRRKAFRTYFQPGTLSEILTIANLRHAASRI